MNLSEEKVKFVKEEVMNYDINIFTKNGEKGIQGKYGRDLDIKQIYNLALQCIQDNATLFLPILRKELKMKEDKLTKRFSDLSYIKIKAKQDKIENLKAKIEKLENAVATYQERCQKLIQQYEDSGKTVNIKTEEYKARFNIIQQFLKITEEYIPIHLTQDLNLKSICLCAKPPKVFHVIGEGCKMCPVCGYELIMFDTNRISAIPKSTYDDWGTFHLVIQNYQGLQNKIIAPDLFEKLDKYFTSLSLPSGKEIREMPLNDQGRKNGTSRVLMTQALNSCGYTNLADIQLIMANYWGYPLPNLNRHMDDIQIRYEKCRPLYYHYKGDRKSSLSAQFRLFQILVSMGFEVDPRDFKLVLTPDLKREYNDIWEKVATDLEWNWHPL